MQETYELTNVIFNVIRGDIRREVFLVGTNLDRANKGKREVSYETALSYAATRNITVYEIDASDYEEVEELFHELLEKIVSNFLVICLENKGVAMKTGPRLDGLASGDGFQKRYNRCC